MPPSPNEIKLIEDSPDAEEPKEWIHVFIFMSLWRAVKHCLVRTLRCLVACFEPLGHTFSRSNIVYLSWAIFVVVIFSGLIINKAVYESEANEKDKKNHLLEIPLKTVLVVFMMLSIAGISYCFYHRKDQLEFVKYKPFSPGSIPTHYLLVGLYVFGIGALFIDMLELWFYIHAQIDGWHVKSVQVEILFSAVRFLFIAIQIAFLQSFWSATLNEKWGVKLLLFHIMATNLCVWLMYVAEETHIFTNRADSMKLIGKANDSSDPFEQKLESISSVLNPFTLEYSLIVAGILYGILSGMEVFTERDAEMPEVIPPGSYFSMGEQINETQTRRGCQPGMLIGIIFAIVLLVAEMSLRYEKASPAGPNYLHIIFNAWYMILYACMAISAWRIMTNLQHCTRHDERAARPDDILLGFSLVGALLFDVFVIIAAASCTHQFSHIFVGLMLAVGVMQFLVRIYQTWILILSHKFDGHLGERAEGMKTIRQSALFLLFTNLGIWALDSFFETQNFADDSYSCGNYSFGADWWGKLVAFTYPIVIFFRFHSAAMSFDVWAQFRFQRINMSA